MRNIYPVKYYSDEGFVEQRFSPYVPHISRELLAVSSCSP